MSRNSFCVLLFAALFVFAQASEFQRFALNQGRVSMRNLASSDSAERLALEKYGENFAVSVNLGEEYMKANGLTDESETALTIALYTNTTVLCRDCYQFKTYNCKELTNTCKADTSANLTLVSPYFEMYGGHPVNHAISIGSDVTNPAWKLSTPATLFNANHESETVIQKITIGRFYIANFNTYGLLGLGTGGKAASNFQGGHPLFSVSLNSAGYGSLIFGKDSSLYKAKDTPMVLTADTNWTMKAKAISFGNYSNSTYSSNLAFDLQHPGIAIPMKYFDDPNFVGKDLHSVMKKSFSLTRYAEFYHAYKGKLTDLPDLVFTLENGKQLTIPPSAYTRKSATEEGLYTILISMSTSIGNVNNPDEKVEFTIIGWPILSHYYTIFEQEAGAQPTITLYPALATETYSLSTSTKALIAVAFIAFVAIAYIFGQKKGAATVQKEIALVESNYLVSKL